MPAWPAAGLLTVVDANAQRMHTKHHAECKGVHQATVVSAVVDVEAALHATELGRADSQAGVMGCREGRGEQASGRGPQAAWGVVVTGVLVLHGGARRTGRSARCMVLPAEQVWGLTGTLGQGLPGHGNKGRKDRDGGGNACGSGGRMVSTSLAALGCGSRALVRWWVDSLAAPPYETAEHGAARCAQLGHTVV